MSTSDRSPLPRDAPDVYQAPTPPAGTDPADASVAAPPVNVEQAVEETIATADCPVTVDWVAGIVWAVPSWSVSHILSEICRRVPMSLEASRILLVMIQAAIAMDRHVAAELSTTISASVTDDPSGRTAAQIVMDLLDSAARRPQ